MEHERLVPVNIDKLVFREEGFAIRGAIFEVYREMGPGFLENVYQECLEIEFRRRCIPHDPRRDLKLNYKGEELRQFYRPDFICFDKIIVEIKAVRDLAPEHTAQVLNYLKATGMRLGFLVNFHSHPKVDIKQYAN
jgi:GxxExxY protein